MPDINDTPEAIVDVLSYSRVQDTLCYLRQQNRPIAQDDLARRIASWESDQSRADVSERVVQEIAESLQRDHIPKLVELGVVEREQEYDEEYLTVTDKIETVEPNLRPRSELGPTEYRVE
jgi:hypothetical protein